MHGHFIEPSWPTLILKSNLKDFSKVGWIDWVNHAQFYPNYVVSDDFESFELFTELSNQVKPGISYSLYNVACARKLLFAFSYLSFNILQDLVPLKTSIGIVWCYCSMHLLMLELENTLSNPWFKIQTY